MLYEGINQRWFAIISYMGPGHVLVTGGDLGVVEDVVSKGSQSIVETLVSLESQLGSVEGNDGAVCSSTTVHEKFVSPPSCRENNVVVPYPRVGENAIPSWKTKRRAEWAYKQ